MVAALRRPNAVTSGYAAAVSARFVRHRNRGSCVVGRRYLDKALPWGYYHYESKSMQGAMVMDDGANNAAPNVRRC